jgi:uncharacterized phage protein gp47/JayE|tara:strand:+ start:480 stop:725 length:246 start_codon:yes stop_codon:yes gene_type:complete
MKIIQKDDSHELLFSDEEIKIINKKKKLIFTHKGMSQFANALANVAAVIVQKIPKKDLQMNLNDNINPKETKGTPSLKNES